MENALKIKNRNSGIDLLKIIAIFGIVLCHTVPCFEHFDLGISTIGYLPCTTAPLSFQELILLFFRNFGQVGNLIFIICSAWFLSDSQKLKKEKISCMIADSFMISVIYLAVFFIYGIKLSFGKAIQLVFPLTYEVNWFIMCYLLMYAIHPLLNMIIEKQSKKTNLSYSIAFITLYMFIGFIKKGSYYYSTLIGFIGIYFIVAFLKKYMLNTISNKKYNYIALCIGIVGWIGFNFSINILGTYGSFFQHKMKHWSYIMNPLFFLVAFSLFNLFRQLNFKSKTINYLSSLTLLIYIIHVNPFIQCYLKIVLFNNIYTTYTYKYVVLWIVLFGIILFLLTVAAAIIYNKILQPIIHKLANKIIFILTKIYLKVENKLLKLD